MPAMQALEAEDLVLEPLVAGHAEAMFALLCDRALYRWIDEAPPADVGRLRARYARLETRTSADGREHWLNWVVRRPGGKPLGFVQATVLDNGSAWIAYLLGSAHQGQGLATRATATMLAHLEAAYGVRRLLANVEAENGASIRLLRRLGFRAATAAEAARHAPTASERIYLRDRSGPDRTGDAAPPPAATP
jgi:RimJ/RimL family protein N-acetyltransferase